MKKYYFELTDEQKGILSPTIDKISDANVRGEPVMLLAQIHIIDGRMFAVTGIVPHGLALELQRVMGKKRGETTAKDEKRIMKRFGG